jgi:hypothetical protein
MPAVSKLRIKTLFSAFITCFLFTGILYSQTYRNVPVNNTITEVQPMTGIVMWHNNGNANYLQSTDAVTLEFAYMKYNDIVKQKGVYNWSVLENRLNTIASRNHQAIIRFYFVYPQNLPDMDGKTTVPDYIKDRNDYADFKGKGDGAECYFPDWRNQELQDFALDFYTEYANQYDNDPRLAFVQTGFGLWSEYHVWSGQITVDGKTYNEAEMVGLGFPSKAFQEKFLQHLNTVFVNTPWNVSINVANTDYSPVETNPALKNLHFGLFDDSFMCEEHDTYNIFNWQFFGAEKYKTSPAGGEFNYYTTADQEGVLNPDGWRGKTYEQAAAQYHITYMIGNDQPEYRPMSRIKEAGMANGYKFKVEEFLVSETSSQVTIKNTGIAPIYYDAFVTVNGIRATGSLKGLSPGEQQVYTLETGGNNPILTIECDRLLPNQQIQWEGNSSTDISSVKEADIQWTVTDKMLSITGEKNIQRLQIISLTGNIIKDAVKQNTISLTGLDRGIYLVVVSSNTNTTVKKIFLQQ